MIKDSIAILAATPPAKFIFHIGKANARLRELTAQLGLPAEKIYNAKQANARIVELEKTLASLPAPRPAAEPPPAAGSLQSIKELDRKIVATDIALAQATEHCAGIEKRMAELKTSQIAEVTLAALAKDVFKTDAKSDFASLQKQFTDAGLSVPGLAPAPPNPHFTPKFTGLARSVRADRQLKINKFFGIK
jgi:uncharacterized coiled-coil protein SlyX